jgi:hypothetical protein
MDGSRKLAIQNYGDKMNNKIYTFKISADNKTFRIIEIKGSKTLYDLASFIIKSFDFDMDHAFGFYNNIKDIYRSDEIYELFADMDDCEPSDRAKSVKNTEIYSAFQLKKKMVFLFDYGDDWIFLIECKNISDPIAQTRYPRVSEKVGKSPEQYPNYDEE